jgi:uncharacterized protein (DUF2141 family)
METIIKKTLLLLISISLFSFQLKEEEETYSSTITVTDLRNSEGVVQFAIYNTEDSIPDEKYKNYYKIDKVVISNNTATIVFNNIPKGIYAINVLHDENKNGKIDKKFLLPLPKEGVGFSNYETLGISNRPKFSKASFVVNTNTTKIIKIIYM